MKRDYGEMKGVPDSVIDSLARVIYPKMIAYYGAQGEVEKQPPEALEAPKEEKDKERLTRA